MIWMDSSKELHNWLHFLLYYNYTLIKWWSILDLGKVDRHACKETSAAHDQNPTPPAS